MPPSPLLRRHFLSWDGAWLPQVTAWLAGNGTGAEPLDLSHVLAVVPTRQSGRRLREALAEHAAARGTAVFPPRVHTPDTLLASGVTASDVASCLEALLAWIGVLRELEPGDVPDVFPSLPPRRDHVWAARLAEVFFRLQTRLAEGGLEFSDVASRAGVDFSETERWRQLAELERRQVERLAVIGRREPHAARRAGAKNLPPPAGVTRVVVLALPDPLPLTVGLLERWAEILPVDVAVFAPGEEADAFDAFGRPMPAHWDRRSLGLPDFERQVHLCADPAAEAGRAADLANRYAPAPDGMVALGVSDPEVLPLLENALSRATIAHYNPEGRARRGERLHLLLSALARLARDSSFEAVGALARCPDFLLCLRTRFGADYSIATFLAELDDVRARHLSADLDALAAAAGARRLTLARALVVLSELRAALAAEEFAAGAFAALGIVFEARRLDSSRASEAREAESVEAWGEIMRECAAAAALFPELSVAEWWELALRMFGETRRTEEKPAGALELQGWLELPWEDAPHLVVAGLNDGIVPEAVDGDAFLPESLREKLGLKSNAARFARDAYLLHVLIASRGAGRGRIDLLFAKTSAAGDPLRPSRLLLRCRDAELPARIAFLFRPAESIQPNLAWTRAWKHTPRREPPPARVPVTGLRTWLACPFRFYLQHVLKMEPVDAAKSELDARDFGTLCHTALEAMAREPALRDCVDENILREFLLAELDRAALTRFGADAALPLVIQLESARQRLGRMAAVQARERAGGWVTERVESMFSLTIAGLEVRGKIDRIDRHENSGAYRVLDYKTSDSAVPPHKSHLRPRRAGDEELPEWMHVVVEGRDCVWADLQLPIYLRSLAGDLGEGAAVSCGYVNLPKAAGETDLALWPELGPDLLAAARACTDGVAAAIRAGRFWPPAEMAAERDSFAALFHHGAAESVAWEVQP